MISEHSARSIAALRVLIPVVLLFDLLPLQPPVWDAATHSSWPIVLSWLAANHTQFGPEAVFTYGPLASLFSNSVSPAVTEIALTPEDPADSRAFANVYAFEFYAAEVIR